MSASFLFLVTAVPSKTTTAAAATKIHQRMSLRRIAPSSYGAFTNRGHKSNRAVSILVKSRSFLAVTGSDGCLDKSPANQYISSNISDPQSSQRESYRSLTFRGFHSSAALLDESSADKATLNPDKKASDGKAPTTDAETSTASGSESSADTSSTTPKATDGGSVEYSTPELAADAAKHKAGLSDSTVPSWQNPLLHDNPEIEKTFREDFDSEEEFEAAVAIAPPLDGGPPDHIKEFGEEILQLTVLEMNELTNKIGQHFGFHEGMLSPDGDLSGGGDDDDDEDGESAAAVEEKTVFDLKLVSFDDKSKIKVIKEVRSIAGLGLKEAKELVEGAPKIITKDLKMEAAEELKAKLEAVGATIEIV